MRERSVYFKVPDTVRLVQLTTPEKVPVVAFTDPQVRVFAPIPRGVFNVEPLQVHLKTLV